MANNSSKKTFSTIGIYAIVLALYVVAFFLIPFPKVAVSYIAFGFTIFAILASMAITALAFKPNNTLASKVYGFPVFRSGYIYVAIQFVLGLVFCIIGIFTDVPVWIAILLFIILLGFAAISVIATDNTRDVVQEADEELARVTVATKMFRLDISSVVDNCQDAQLKKALEKLAEDIRFSDPVSSPATERAEAQLFDEMRLLKGLVELNQVENSLTQIRKITNLLAERNRLCKAFKRK